MRQDVGDRGQEGAAHGRVAAGSFGRHRVNMAGPVTAGMPSCRL